MRTYFNVVIDNKKYGVLVGLAKYHIFFKKAKSVFKKDDFVNDWIKEKLVEYLNSNQNIKKDFLDGISIRLISIRLRL